MNKPTQQQIIEAYKQLPPPVREFLADPDQLARVLTDMRNRHNLHVDIIGRVSESVGYLLLGLTSSGEFKDALKVVNVPEDTINEMISEINQKIFIPLRESMKNAATGAPPQPQRPRIEGPVPQARPQPSQPASPQPLRYFHLENKLSTPSPKGGQSTIPRPISPTTSVMPPATQKPAPLSQPQQGKSALAQAIAGAQQRQPAPAQPQSINILPPSPKLEQPPAASTRPSVPAIAPLPPKTILPQPMFPRHLNAPLRGASGEPATRNVLAAAALPINLPGAMPPRTLPVNEPSDIIAAPKSTPAVSMTPPKPYSSDPYREPIEP